MSAVNDALEFKFTPAVFGTHNPQMDAEHEGIKISISYVFLQVQCLLDD